MTTKQSPADFLVEEILSADFLGRVRGPGGAFALYRLTKENLTTPDAAALLAKTIGVRPGEVAYAGLKDRHARTVQHITSPVHAPRTARRDAPANPDDRAQVQGAAWSAERIGWLDFPITADAIAANRFRIVVRDLTREACGQMDEAVQLLQQPAAGTARDPAIAARTASTLVYVNYFGDQRFGSARHGRGLLATHLIRGEFEDAMWLAIATWARKDSRRQKEFKRAVAEKWKQWDELVAALPRCPERRALEHLATAPDDYGGAFAALPYGFQELAVHAYQSYLWNCIARRLVAEHCPGPILAVHDPFGEMQFPAAATIPPALAALDLPVLGRDARLQEPWRGAAQAVLAEEGLTTAMLRIPGLRRPHFGGASRRLFATASNFALTPRVADSPMQGRLLPPATVAGTPSGRPPTGPSRGKRPARFARTLSFELPRGAYATVLLRALGQ